MSHVTVLESMAKEQMESGEKALWTKAGDKA